MSQLRTALTALADGNVRDAEEHCQKILACDPHHLGALEVLAKAQWKLQQFGPLEQTTLSLIALNPFEPGYFGLRGMALRALGRYDEAARCMARDPSTTEALNDLKVFQQKLYRDMVALGPAHAVRFRDSRSHPRCQSESAC